MRKSNRPPTKLAVGATCSSNVANELSGFASLWAVFMEMVAGPGSGKLTTCFSPRGRHIVSPCQGNGCTHSDGTACQLLDASSGSPSPSRSTINSRNANT